MTDRQTDKKEPKSDTRSTHWCVTAYDKEEWRRLDVSGDHPLWVKEVYGGLETCPDTGRVHYQAHVACRAQARWSTVKKWLPTAHIIVSNSPAESIAYCLKLDTAAAQKKIIENPNAYMTDRKAMEMLVETCKRTCECMFNYEKKLSANQSEVQQLRCCEDDKEDFWHRVRAILMTHPHLCGLYAKPDLYRLWKNTKSVWIARDRSRGIVLPPATPAAQIIFSPENTNASPISTSNIRQVCEEARDAFAPSPQGQSEEGNGGSPSSACASPPPQGSGPTGSTGSSN